MSNYIIPMNFSTKYNTNNAVETHITGLISLILPDVIFRITQDNIPNIIPFEIEYVKGINTTATKPPITSAISPSNSIFLTELNIKRPTNSIAGVVANDGIARNIGERTIEARNNNAVVTAV